MKNEHLQIAIDKADDEPTKTALQRMQPLVLEIEAFEKTFIDRINANKAARGEPPTHLSAEEKAELDAFSRDEAELYGEISNYLREMDSAEEIVRIFHGTLKEDIDFQESSLSYYHPSDRHIGEEGLSLKRQLLSRLDGFLGILVG